MLNVLDSKFDEFNELAWRPFVGENYISSNFKILLIGESHYKSADEINPNFEKKDFSRWVVDEMGIKQYDYQSKFFKNLNKMFAENNPKQFWDKIAFYNFIQRPMTTINEKPNSIDFKEGWKVFEIVLKILKPDYCIFLGNRSADFFCGFCVKNNISASNVTRYEKINEAYFKRSQININDLNTELIFIKHPSMAFNTENWLNILKVRYPKLIAHMLS